MFMEAEEYYQSLIDQDYTPEQAEGYTKQHYPEFILENNEPKASLPLPVSTETDAILPLSEGSQQIPMPLPMPLPGGSMPQPITTIYVEAESQLPKTMRIFSGAIGILMAFILLVWTLGIVNPILTDNIEGYLDEGTSSADKLVNSLKNVQIMTYLSVGILLATMVVAFLSMLNKTKWWLLPAIALFLMAIFVSTAAYSTSAVNTYYADCDDEVYENCYEIEDEKSSIFDSDPMFSAYCNIAGLVIIGIMSLISRGEKKSESDSNEKEGQITPPLETKKDSNSKLIWVISVVVLIIGASLSLVAYNAYMNPLSNGDSDSSSPVGNTFEGRDAISDPMTENGGDALVVVDFITGDGLNWATVDIKISIDNGAYVTCEHSNSEPDTGCYIDKLETEEDIDWSPGESILIYEGDNNNLCSSSCSVTVKVIKKGFGNQYDESLVELVILAE